MRLQMERRPVNLAEKFKKFSEHWSPKTAATDAWI
jgi:hypothetical protein